MMSKFNWEDIFKKIVWIVAICFVAFVFMTIRSYVFNSEHFFYLQQFEIHGNRYLTHRDIVSLSGLKLGDQLFDSNLTVVENKIKRSPYIKKIEIERRLPSTLLIFIEEEEPIAYLTNNNLMLISEDARLLPRAIDFDFPDLAVINVNLKEDVKIGDFIQDEKVLKSIHFLQVAKWLSVDLFSIITEIKLSPKKTVVKLINGGAELKYSDENLNEQLLNFSYFLDKKENLNFLSRSEYIDIRFKDRIIIKDRNKR